MRAAKFPALRQLLHALVLHAQQLCDTIGRPQLHSLGNNAIFH